MVTTWGVCPCTMAKVFGFGDGPDAPCAQTADRTADAAAPQGKKPCCCCTHDHEADPSEGTTDAPADEECPCCSHGGCLRDLPPQVQSADLVLPTPTFLDLPLPLLVTALVHEAPVLGVAAFDAGPPASRRPHASPVGIVRLLS